MLHTKLSLAGNTLPSPSSRKVWSEKIKESRNFFVQCTTGGAMPAAAAAAAADTLRAAATAAVEVSAAAIQALKQKTAALI